jgi:hypothetical protein
VEASVNGGWPGIWNIDKSDQWGEALYHEAEPFEIWTQPPGTPVVGQRFLDAWHVTGNEFYLDASVDAAYALAWGQSKCGGWRYLVDVEGLSRDAELPRPENSGVFDDNTTQGTLTFLINLDKAVDEPWLDKSIERGLDFVVEAQYDNGGWPQIYPLAGGYHDYYTFNDNVINDCIRLMLLAHEQYGDDTYLESALAGGDFIVLSQGDPPQAGWAQQYNMDMEPAWARSFEPPGICSAVTARNIRTLIDLYVYSGEERYLQPIEEAVDWLEDSRLEDGGWARFYEIGTNTPIFGDRDGEVHYDINEISEERRSGYGWLGSWGESAIHAVQQLNSVGAEDYAAAESSRQSDEDVQNAIAGMQQDVADILAALNEDGLWPSERFEGKADVFTFTKNMRVLIRYYRLHQER